MNWLKKKIADWLGLSDVEKTVTNLSGDMEKTDHLVMMLEARQQHTMQRVDERIKELDELTRMDVDIGYRGPCTVILTGVYRGRAYVQFYDMHHDEFRHHVEVFQAHKKAGCIRNVDAPYGYTGSFAL